MPKPKKSLTWKNNKGQSLENVRVIPGRSNIAMAELAAGIEGIDLGEFHEDDFVPLNSSPPGSPVAGPPLAPSTTHPGAFKRPRPNDPVNRRSRKTRKSGGSGRGRKGRRGRRGSRRS
jgi:hypothetical protein